MQRREKLNFIESLYLGEVLKGVFFTFSKLVRNLSIYLLNSLGLAKNKKPWVTIEYPSAIREYFPRYRGRHRLVLNDHGEVRCTACFLCATACPSKCIYIEAQDGREGGCVGGTLGTTTAEKFPKRYEIDTLRCIYCGFCVNACPVDAIRMDTGIQPEIYPPKRSAYIETKEVLVKRSKELQKQTVAEVRQAHLKKMQRVEKFPFQND
ncbi:MAG: NADH-quinone oxidoreductase subunit I [Deltaproteobacteria bacterium]|jgi:NADH-quinone oxidoreductase subunit I|nr:NADH-quinone oxidoreductase subunit I [Deltaproteobacteria bacterium]